MIVVDFFAARELSQTFHCVAKNVAVCDVVFYSEVAALNAASVV